MTRDTPQRRSAALAFGAFLALTLLSVWPLFGHFSSRLPSDLGDPALNTWILWWNTKAVPLTAAWWNAPMFAPAQNAFALSESFLSLWPLTTPLIRAGVSPVAAYNVAFILAGPLSALGAYLLAWRLTRRRSAAMVAGLAFGFSPYRIAQLPHLQMEWACWIPLALYALHAYVETSAARWLAAFGACWMLVGLSNGYFLIFVPVLLALWVAWFARESRHIIGIVSTFVIATLPLLPLLLAYRERQRAFGLARGIGEIQAFSADLSAVWAASRTSWLSRIWTWAPGPEGELYPGLALLLLCAAGAVSLSRSGAFRDAMASAARGRVRNVLIALALLSAALSVAVATTGGWDLRLGPFTWTAHKVSRSNSIAFWCAVAAGLGSAPVRLAWRRRSPLTFYLIASAAMLLMALGPAAKAFGMTMLYKAPYSWLMLLPGGDSVRVPARFAQLMMLCLSVAGALAWARLVAPGRRPMTAGIATALLLEGWIIVPVANVPAPLDVPALAADTIIVELPMTLDYPLQTRALLHAIAHGRPIANGFSGYEPPHFAPLRDGFMNRDTSVIDALRRHAPVAAFIAADADAAELTALTASGGTIAATAGQGTWVTWAKTDAPADAPRDPALTGITAVSSIDADAAVAVIDGRLGTRWTTAIPQEPGQSLTVAIDHDAMVSGLEMRLGAWNGDFPAGLEIAATDAAGVVRTVWRGSIRGLAVSGALREPTAVPFVLRFDPPVPARRLTLTQTATDHKRAWSVAELKLFGR